jgi:hypothetical protein
MKHRAKHLLRLALAAQAFHEADAIAEHLLVTNIKTGSQRKVGAAIKYQDEAAC